jgi:hypothetical protein
MHCPAACPWMDATCVGNGINSPAFLVRLPPSESPAANEHGSRLRRSALGFLIRLNQCPRRLDLESLGFKQGLSVLSYTRATPDEDGHLGEEPITTHSNQAPPWPTVSSPTTWQPMSRMVSNPPMSVADMTSPPRSTVSSPFSTPPRPRRQLPPRRPRRFWKWGVTVAPSPDSQRNSGCRRLLIGAPTLTVSILPRMAWCCSIKQP